MSGGCDELCGSFSSQKLCNAIAKSSIATYLVMVIAGVSAVIAFVLSITQISSFPDIFLNFLKSCIAHQASPYSMLADILQ